MMVLYFAVIQQQADINSLRYLVCLSLNYANCSINPFIYMFKYEDFKQGAKALFGITNKVTTVTVATGSVI